MTILRNEACKYAGTDWEYDYREIFSLCDEKQFQRVTSRRTSLFASLTKSWDVRLNSEWVCRTYLATKMILNATVLVKSLEFAEDAGMRIANAYIAYYATLSLLRSVVFLSPLESWNEGALIKIPHSTAINSAFDCIARFDKERANQLKHTTHKLKAQRDLISYRVPSSGDGILDNDYNLIYLLTVLAEVAQWQSELLEKSISKNADQMTFALLDEHIAQLTAIELEGFTFLDHADRNWLKYIQRKVLRPYNLASFMREGHTEDFMAAWDGNDGLKQAFQTGTPIEWQAIFDIP